MDVQILRAVLDYEPDTGRFFWKPRRIADLGSATGASHRQLESWNDRYAGKEALRDNSRGYLGGFILRRRFKAHRVAWAIHYGVWPQLQIDHINRIRSDNRIVNLREVTNSQNQLNRDRSAGGVTWHKQRSRWHARITHEGDRKHLGLFDRRDDAIRACQEARAALDQNIELYQSQ